MNHSHRWIQTYHYKAEAEQARQNFTNQGEEVTDIEFSAEANRYFFYVVSMFARYEAPATL